MERRLKRRTSTCIGRNTHSCLAHCVVFVTVHLSAVNVKVLLEVFYEGMMGSVPEKRKEAGSMVRR